MRVVSHGYGGFGGSGMEVVSGMHAGQSQGVGCIPGDAGALPEWEVMH